MSKPIRVGGLRLVDSAPVIVAEAHGLFRDQGIDVQISIEPSWSNVADKLTYGVLDAAVMLPPLALAACAGLRGPKAVIRMHGSGPPTKGGIGAEQKSAHAAQAFPSRNSLRRILPTVVFGNSGRNSTVRGRL